VDLLPPTSDLLGSLPNTPVNVLASTADPLLASKENGVPYPWYATIGEYNEAEGLSLQ